MVWYQHCREEGSSAICSIITLRGDVLTCFFEFWRRSYGELDIFDQKAIILFLVYKARDEMLRHRVCMVVYFLSLPLMQGTRRRTVILERHCSPSVESFSCAYG